MEFVAFEIAKKLKEKGFREKCFAIYTPYSRTFKFNEINVDKRPTSYKLNIEEFRECYNYYKENNIDAPTISQVLKWFREEHHLHFEVVATACWYNLIISDTPEKGGTDRYYSYANDDDSNNSGWDEYEDCVLYGIKYVLDNLI